MIDTNQYPNGFVHAVIAGHGGFADGKYHILKEGSKQAKMPDGSMIYEGEENRYIKDEIITQSQPMAINVIDIVPEVDDVPRPDRIDRVNVMFDHWKRNGYMLLLWELHLNAFNGKASGTEIFTTRKNNFSDHMATVWWDIMEDVIGNSPYSDHKVRPDYTDGDPDKERDFDIIKNVRSFGVLIEFFFFDHYKSVQDFCNPDGYHLWAKTVVKAMEALNHEFYPQNDRTVI